MKIAIIQPRTSYFVGGAEKISIRHAEFLANLGNEVVLYSVNHPRGQISFLYEELVSKKNEKINLINFSIPQKYSYLYDQVPGQDPERWHTESILFGILIADNLKEQKPDIVLSYYLPDAFFKDMGLTNVIYFGGYPSEKINIYTSFLRFCDSAIYISQVVKEYWEGQVSADTPSFLLPTAVDYPIPQKREIYPKSSFNIVFAGRLIERKGVEDLIESFGIVHNEIAETHLWILGDGPDKDHLIETVNRNSLQSNVTFTGLVDNPGDYFRMADICVFPSRNKDGLMGVVLEAMAVGSVVLTTIGSGSEDVITNNENGLLTHPNNPKSMSDIIIRTLKDPSLREKIGREAEKKIREDMTWEKNTSKLNAIFKEILSLK